MSYYFNHYLARRMASAPRGGGGDDIEIPTVYQRVEYIQSDGAQYIDLDYTPTGNTKAVLNAQYVIAQVNSDIFGVYQMDSVRFHIGSYLSKFHFGSGGESNWVNLTDIDTSRHIFTLCGDGSCAVDSTTGNTGVVQFPENTLKIYLFKISYLDSTRGETPLIVYRCQIYESDVLVRDLIPCYRKSDNKPGMWDMVTWSFYTNANTSALTDFTVGPDVIQPATKYIVFEDRAVEAICVANWSSDGIGLTMQDAAAVTANQFGTTFKGNTQITSFDELQYFTGVTYIPMDAFKNCSSLTSIILPNNITGILGWAFDGCTSLALVNIPSGVTAIGDRAFNSTAIRSISIPEGVTQLQEGTFSNCHFLSSVSLPSSLRIVSGSVFSYTSLTSIVIPSGVTAMGGNMFTGCTSLVSVGLPSSLTGAIGDSFFDGCTSLGDITIPAGVTGFGAWAFSHCRNMANMTVFAATPPTLESSSLYDTALSNIYVPSESVAAYKAAPGWSDYASIIQAIPNS